MNVGPIDPAKEVVATTGAFLAAFYPALATSIICISAFLILRKYFPDVYDSKRERVRLAGSKKQREEMGDMPPELPKLMWDWILLLASFSDEDIIRFCGTDSLMFLRFIRMCFKAAFCMMIYGLAVLLPIHAIGQQGASQFNKFSASNVSSGSPYFWAHLVGCYLFTGILLYFLYVEYNVYVDLRQKYMKSPTVQSYSIVIRDIPTDVDRETVERYLGGLLGHESLAIHLVEDAAPYDKLIAEKDDTLFGLEGAKQKFEKAQIRPTNKIGFLGLFGERVDSLDYYEKALKDVNDKIKKLHSQERGFAHAAIVTFETIRVATAFQHIPLQSAVRFLKVTPCPARNDLLWDNLGVPLITRGIRTLLVIGVVFFIIFCYTIPVGFISSLANLKTLSQTKHLEWLKPVADFSPQLTSFLEGFVPPFILGLFFSLVPTFMAALSRAESLPAESDAQTSAIWKVFLFSLFDNFLVVTFAGSILQNMNKLKEVADHPSSAMELLATTLPAQSNFFMNFIMLAGLSVMPLEIVRIGPLMVTWLKRRFLASSTFDHLKCMTQDIAFHEIYAFPLLVFLPTMSYSVLAPLMMIFVLAYYGMTYCVWLNQLLYIYNVPYQSGGSQFPIVFRCCMVSIVMSQILLAGVLTLNKVPVQTILIAPLIAFTVYIGSTMTTRFHQLGHTLTLENLLSTDVKEMAPKTMELLKNAYELHQDDGTGDEFSKRTIQPLVEPYAITYDGLLEDLDADEHMQSDMELNEDIEDGSSIPVASEKKLLDYEAGEELKVDMPI